MSITAPLNAVGLPDRHVTAEMLYEETRYTKLPEANIGFMYEFDQGVPKRYAEALKWWRKAALSGDPDR